MRIKTTSADDVGSRFLWERWDEVDRLLAAALDLPAGDREEFVRREVAEDLEFRELILRLVRRLATDSARELSPGDSVVAGAFGVDKTSTAFVDLPPGTEIGRYVIMRRHGRGGMATVYEAQRSDGAYQQRVAVKVLRRGLDTEDLIRRFLTERQILSSLAHPNIARLLDGGSTSEGRPYLVMEFVEGEPITTYADARRLDIRGRLALFLGVTDAVHAAHKQLVVHRDIKPSNTLVDEDGGVKLLDFGIAKLLTGDAEHTEVGVRALTPEYASPEQLRGDRITTATDVYQLGLLLRELVVGVRPPAAGFPHGEAITRASRLATQAIPGSREPEARASDRATTPGRLARALSGDLDVILDKALRTEPEQRYASADELGTDLRRHLRGQTILAHPESARYRMRKFVRRHRLSVAASAAVVLLLVAYAVTATVQSQRIAAAGTRAEREARTAEQVTEFMTLLFQSSDPRVALSDTVTVAGVLDAGAERIRTELRDQPAVRAALLLAIGRAYTGLGRYDQADTLLMESLALHRAVYDSGHARVANVLRALGTMHLLARNFPVADHYFRDELDLRTTSGSVPDTMLARMLQNLSATQREIGSPDSALTLIRQAVSLRRSAADTASEDFVNALGGFALALRSADALDSAEAVYREVLRRQERLHGPDSYEVATTRNNLGFLLRTREDYGAAEQEYRKAVRIARDVFGDGHPTTLMFSSNLASVLMFQGNLDEVAVIGRERIAAAENQWPNGHWRVGAAYNALGKFFVRYGRPADALGPLDTAISSFSANVGPDHKWTASARHWYGIALLLLRRTEQAAPILDSSFDRLRTQRANFNRNDRDDLERARQLLMDNGHEERAAELRLLLQSADSLPPQR